jgi:hypothetical protein
MPIRNAPAISEGVFPMEESIEKMAFHGRGEAIFTQNLLKMKGAAV